MTIKTLKVFHVLALCIFVGSIPAHIILGGIAQSAQDAETFAVLHQAKYVLTYGLTTVGIALTLISGILLGLSQKHTFRTRWLRTKLFLVLAIVINGAIILTPTAERMKNMAMDAMNSGALSPEFHAAENQEAIAGAINIVLILVIFILAIVKPSLGSPSKEV